MEDLRLKSFAVGPIPIVNRYIERLGIGQILSGHIAHDGMVPPEEMILIMLRNIVMEREPVYGIHDWASRIHPALLGIGENDIDRINDDRMGRALDALFSADRATMLTELVVGVLKEFQG